MVTKMMSQIYSRGRSYEAFLIFQWTISLHLTRFFRATATSPVISYPSRSLTFNTFNYPLETFSFGSQTVGVYVTRVLHMFYNFSASSVLWNKLKDEQFCRRKYLDELDLANTFDTCGFQESFLCSIAPRYFS